MTQPGFFKGICRCSLRRERFSAVSILNGIKRLPTFCCDGTQEIRHQPFPVAGLFQKALPQGVLVLTQRHGEAITFDSVIVCGCFISTVR